MIASIEYTDLYAGNANYSWVRRATVEIRGLSELQIIRKLKKAIGLNGIRAYRLWDSGDTIQYKVLGQYTTFFITYEY